MKGHRKFPLLLTTGRVLSQYNVGAQTRRTANNVWHKEDILDLHESMRSCAASRMVRGSNYLVVLVKQL